MYLSPRIILLLRDEHFVFKIYDRDFHFSHNAPISGVVCGGGLCAKMRACEHAHKSTTRTTSAALDCYAPYCIHNIQLNTKTSSTIGSHKSGDVTKVISLLCSVECTIFALVSLPTTSSTKPPSTKNNPFNHHNETLSCRASVLYVETT